MVVHVMPSVEVIGSIIADATAIKTPFPKVTLEYPLSGVVLKVQLMPSGDVMTPLFVEPFRLYPTATKRLFPKQTLYQYPVVVAGVVLKVQVIPSGEVMTVLVELP